MIGSRLNVVCVRVFVRPCAIVVCVHTVHRVKYLPQIGDTAIARARLDVATVTTTTKKNENDATR